MSPFSWLLVLLLSGTGVLPLPAPDSTEGVSAPYTVRVNGVSLPLARVGHPGGRDEEVYYARFAGVSSATIVVSVTPTGPLKATVDPQRLVKHPTVDSVLTFVAEEPGPRIVRLSVNDRSLPRLIIIMEPEPTLKPDPARTAVYRVDEHGVIPNADQPQTAALQRLLDLCAAHPTGGYVVFPPGRFVTGTLRVRDNTVLYLADGAWLAASASPADFPVDPGRTEEGGHGRTHSFSRVILFDHARNAGLAGRGTIDGNGDVLRNQHRRPVQILDAHDCENLVIEGVVLRNTASWTCHLVHSTNVVVRDVRIIADWDVGNADGINPDMCWNVLIERALCYTGDDSFTVKCTNNSDFLRPAYNVQVRDSVAMTYKTALKIGTETYADVRNVLFENIDVVCSSRGIGLWVRDGGKVSQVTFRNIRMELVELPGEGLSGQPFYLTLEERYGKGSTLSDVVIRDVRCRAPWFSLMENSTLAPIERVLLENIDWAVTPRTDKQTPRYLFEFQNAREITLRNLRVDWSEASREHWKGLWPEDAPVRAANISETGK